MIVDSSALVAILLDEPEGPDFALRMSEHSVELSAATLTESMMVVRGKAGDELVRELEELLRSVDALVVPLDEWQARLASTAHARFGRGSGHPARLNYGDCFSYALAITRDQPLLFKGDDFLHTDVRRVE